jgi:putative ABC transport system substrate-binding protein
MHTVGLLHSGNKESFVSQVDALKTILGSDVTVIEQYARDSDQLLKLYAEGFVKNGAVEVIIAAGGPEPTLAAKAATAKLQGASPEQNRKPIVFTTVADPVGNGIVADLKHPGGNLTGMAGKTSELDGPRFLILNALVPNDAAKKERIMAVLTRKGRPNVEGQFGEIKREADNIGVKLKRAHVGPDDDIDDVFADFKKDTVGVVVTADSFFNNRREQIVQLAAKYRLPAIYQWREFVDIGGLVSYAPSLIEAYEEAGIYALRILNGEHPADLPILSPSKIELIVHPFTAINLGIRVPEAIGDKKVQSRY